jgi:pyrophosphatase PpaX
VWHFLFDLDGTILDTTDLIMESFLYAFRQGLGRDIGRTELLEHFGRPLVDQFRIMCPEADPEEIDRLVAIYLEHNEAQHDQWVTLVPGADQGLRVLHDRGYRLGIVTSKRRNMTEKGLRLFQLDGLIDVIVHADSTPHHKPHPEPVLRALSLLHAPPARAAYVGDSPYDMAAGRAAGVRTVGLLHNTFTRPVLNQAGADVVVASWPEVVDILMGWAGGQDMITAKGR